VSSVNPVQTSNTPPAAGTQRVGVYYWEQEDLQFLPEQRKAVDKYVKEKNAEVVAEFTEPLDKKRKHFPELEKAAQFCVEKNIRLVIARLHNLTTADAFTQILLNSKVNFICLDRPTINPYTLAAVVEEVLQRRKEHSARIRAGLEHTTAQLGNPNALKEIVKVNRPKTENAIMFALILLPIIGSYRRQGFSQRKMVDALNNEGFQAPEGGKWVLSQLQKVLERIDLNIIALNSASTLEDCANKGYNAEQTIRTLNAMGVRSPQRGGWDFDGLRDAQERLELIKEIGNFNEFVLDIYPQVLSFGGKGLSDADIAKALNEQKVAIPDRLLWELAQTEEEEEEGGSGTGAPAPAPVYWEAEKIALLRDLAERREHDTAQFVHPQTYQAAKDILQRKK
jgi:hypothetical protein